MPNYSVATTKDQLSRLIDKALAGEQVVITRHGKPTVELRVIEAEAEAAPSKAEIYEQLRQFRATLPFSEESSAALIRRMRDEGY